LICPLKASCLGKVKEKEFFRHLILEANRAKPLNALNSPLGKVMKGQKRQSTVGTCFREHLLSYGARKIKIPRIKNKPTRLMASVSIAYNLKKYLKLQKKTPRKVKAKHYCFDGFYVKTTT